MTITSTFIMYGVTVQVKDIYPIVVGPIAGDEKDGEDDIMTDWMYNTDEIEGFFVRHVPHDQADDEPTVAVGIKICEVELNRNDCSCENLLEAMKKSATVEEDYSQMLTAIGNKQLKKLLADASTVQVNNDCGCCS